MSREKQIEELIDIITDVDENGYAYNEEGYEIAGYANSTRIAEALYNAGYRKQSEGEWIDNLKGYCQCSNCRTSFETRPTTFLFKLNNRFCRNCGAKMKGR